MADVPTYVADACDARRLPRFFYMAAQPHICTHFVVQAACPAHGFLFLILNFKINTTVNVTLVAADGYPRDVCVKSYFPRTLNPARYRNGVIIFKYFCP